MRVSLPGDDLLPYRGPAWDLREEPPEEAPVVTYRLSPEEIAAKYGPPKPHTEPVRNLAFDPRMGKPMLPMTLDVLRRLAADGKTAEEIAAELGRSVAGVKYRARQWGVTLVEQGEQAKPAESKAKVPRSPEWETELRRLYVDEGRSLREIGQIYGVQDSTVAYYLRKFGIKRDKPVADAATRAESRSDATVFLRIAQKMSAEQARAALQSVAELIGPNPLMAAVEIELRVRASG